MHVTDLCPSHELLLVVCGLLLHVTKHAVSSQQSYQSCVSMGIVCASMLACMPKTAVKRHNMTISWYADTASHRQLNVLLAREGKEHPWRKCGVLTGVVTRQRCMSGC